MTETHPDPVRSLRRPSWRRIVGWGAAGVVGLPLALVGTGGAFLETEAGREWLKTTVEAALADPQGVQLTVGAVEGSVFSNLTVHDLRLNDPHGVWLTAKRVQLSWSPSALGRGLLRIETLAARDLTLERLPILPPDPVASDDEGFFELRWLTRVRVGVLDVRDLTLGEALLGQRTQLRITGDSRPASDERLHVRFDLARTDAIPGSLSLEATLGPSPAPLRLHLAAAEPAGGVVARLLNLPGLPPVALRLDGEGPLTGWEGNVWADAGALGQASGRVTAALGAEGAGTLSVDGEVVSGTAAPTVWQAAAGERLAVVLRAERDRRGRVSLAPSRLTGAGWHADVEGWLEDDRFAARLGLEAMNPPLVAALLPGASLAALDLRATGEGRLNQPRGEIILSTGALRVAEEGRAEALEVRASATPDAGRLVLALEATPTGLVLPGVGSVLGTAPVLRAGGLWDPETRVLTLNQARLTGDATTVEASLTVLPDPGRLTEGHLVLDLPDLTRLDGGLRGAARLTVEPRDLSASAGLLEARLEAHDLAGMPLLGPTPVLTARLRPGNEDLRVEDLRLVTDQGLEGGGEGRWSAEGLDVRLALTLDALTRLDAGISGGPLAVTLEARGPLADPALRLEARVPRLDGAGPAWRDLVATLNARGVDSPQGDLTLAGRAGSLPVQAHLPFRLEAGYKALTLEGVRVEAGRARGEGKARIDGNTLPASTASLAFDVPDLAGLGPLGLPALGGALTGRVAYDGRTLSLEARSPGLSSGSARLGALALKGRIDTPLSRPVVTLEAGLTGGTAGPATWRHLGIGVKGPLETPTVQASLDGGALQTPQGPAPLGAGLSLRPGKNGTLRLETLEARAGRHRLALMAPATIKPGAGGVRFVDPLAVRLDRGRLEVSGALGRRNDRLRLTLQAFPLDLVSLVAPGLGLEGQVDGTLEGGGSLARPVGTATLEGRGLRAGALEGHTLQARLNASLDKSLSADLSLDGLSPTPLQATLTVTPGAGLSFPPSTPIAGGMRWSGDLRALWDLTPWVDHRPAGATTLDLQLAGTLGAPVITGQAKLEQGRYENLLTGTVMEDVSLDLEADAARTVRFALAGTDGGPGSLKANGTFSFSDPAHPVGTAALEASRATLVRRDDVTASLDAVLALALGPQGGHLTGEVTTQKVAVRLIDTLGAGVPDLEVLEVGGPGGPLTLDDALAAQAATGPAQAAPLDLDVRVTLPNRVYVTGKGIDTEWKGALHLTGTPDQPVVVGSIENLRGQVELLGRNFSLRQSAVRFDGGRRLDPNLDIRATNTAGKITAVARITGPVSSPQVSFSSEPSLPQDEVIAHILFGKSSGQLSAIEAVQLARAVGEVGGLATGGSFMDTVRGITGLDVLKLGESEGGATTVQAGTYLGENVYIGVVQGMSLGDSAVEVQVDLTPSLSLETKAGASGAGSAGLLWKRDY